MLGEFLQYTKLADEKIIALFSQADPLPATACALFDHVLNAQHIWACRILNLDQQYQVWDRHDPETYGQIWADNFELLQQVMVEVDLEKTIRYTNSQGEEFSGLVKDILLHVFNHSTYHRAQLAILFKAQGLQPPVTDYIMMKRSGEL
ncbi:MAG: DinB family protein [Pedobacter sp.]|nr:DinB family protein [Pedobacter sp.]MDQ8053507.1 DinB family protein [Pedobacter sp.]